MSDDKYLDPATNPMIKIQPFEDVFPDGPELPFDQPLIPLGGYPEKKAAPASVAIATAGYTDEQALEGLGPDELRELMGADEVLNIYDDLFYDSETPAETKLFMRPVITLEKLGSEVLIKRPDRGEHVITAHEADLIRLAMKGKAG